MKKIYSYVLMAAMLLIGTSAWAENFSGTNRAQLQAAIDNASSGTTLVFQNDVDLSDGPIWLGTEDLDASAKSITLDLNGNNVTRSVTGGDAAYLFVLSHGELKVVNNSNKESQIQLNGVGDVTSEGAQIFSVYGSYKSSRWNADGNAINVDSINTRTSGYYSHLLIGKRVTIVGDNGVPGTAIAVDALNAASSPARTAAALSGKTINYFTNLYSGYGYAHGARVDVEGNIIMNGKTGTKWDSSKKVYRGWKCYGIKTNGNLKCPINDDDLSSSVKLNGATVNFSSIDYLNNYGSNKQAHKLDTLDAAFVYVHDGSNITTINSSDRSTAIYASGYAKWYIEGTCEGNVGIYASSGTVTLNNAEISSTATTYTPPTAGGGVSGAGSGIIVNSRDGYAGEIDVTISGNTTVTADAGYGIEETVTTKDEETKVNSVTITGGTISGGDEGTILVTEETAENELTNISITGVTIEVDEDANDPVQIGSQSLEEFLISQSEEETHVSYIDNGNGGQTMIISEGAAPNESANVALDHDAESSVKWTGTSENITADLTLKELEINEAVAQTLTVKDGKTLTIGRVILGKNAKIVVEAGASFIINGSQGISSSSDDCVVIENTETKQGTFLLNPAVTDNNQPHATVNMNVKYAGKDGDDYAWHRFAMPVKALAAAWGKSPNYGTYLYGWDYAANDWAAVAGGSTSMVPWQGYTLTYNEAYNEAEIVVYTFKGQLLGNVDAALNFQKEGFNFFGNSYTGYMDALTLVEGLVGSKVRGTIYMWNETEQSYSAVTLNRLRKGGAYVEDYEKEVASMQTFILQLAGADAANEEVDYASAVWGNPRYGLVPTPAPARRAAEVNDDEAFLKIVVTAENGKSDNVIFTKNSSLSDAYDDGYDAVKYMNANRMNMYSTVDGQNYASVASDNLIGKTLSISTSNDVNYTMSFKVVDGAEYAIRDNVTNKVITIAEGNTYTFAAQPNTKIDGRFEIVGVESVITAIENTEANNEVRGIYTLLGQYVGEDFNALPAGVYIVNGVKVVK